MFKLPVSVLIIILIISLLILNLYILTSLVKEFDQLQSKTENLKQAVDKNKLDPETKKGLGQLLDSFDIYTQEEWNETEESNWNE